MYKKRLIEQKPAVSGHARRCRRRIDGNDKVPVVSLTQLISRTKKRPFGKSFLEFWSHSTKVKSFSNQRSKFQRRNKSLTTKKSETGERIFRIDFATRERQPRTVDCDVSTVDFQFGRSTHVFVEQLRSKF